MYVLASEWLYMIRLTRKGCLWHFRSNREIACQIWWCNLMTSARRHMFKWLSWRAHACYSFVLCFVGKPLLQSFLQFLFEENPSRFDQVTTFWVGISRNSRPKFCRWLGGTKMPIPSDWSGIFSNGFHLHTFRECCFLNMQKSENRKKCHKHPFCMSRLICVNISVDTYALAFVWLCLY